MGAFQPQQFTAQAAQNYMNPYLQAALNPQIEEARRQAQITRLGDANRLTQAGAYGGSRQAIMESELNRNLGQNVAAITGQVTKMLIPKL
jgi:methyl coenzyme M reductase beta subunit